MVGTKQVVSARQAYAYTEMPLLPHVQRCQHSLMAATTALQRLLLLTSQEQQVMSATMS